MRKLKLIVAMTLLLGLWGGCSIFRAGNPAIESTLPIPSQALSEITLPEPRLTGTISLEESLRQRRSVRDYANSALEIEAVSQLLWAAQGITSDFGGRTAPSAGGLYPLEVYLVAGKVNNLSPGVYRYQPSEQTLIQVLDRDIRSQLADAALSQSAVRNGAIDIVITAVSSRTTSKYGERGIRYVYMEAGHAAQNICLQATALNLGTVTIGAFEDEAVKSLLVLAEDETPLYILPVGQTKT